MIIGVPLKNRDRLTPNGSSIVTVYDVVVQEVIKGNIDQGSTVKVALSGGKFQLQMERQRRLKPPDLEK